MVKLTLLIGLVQMLALAATTQETIALCQLITSRLISGVLLTIECLREEAQGKTEYSPRVMGQVEAESHLELERSSHLPVRRDEAQAPDCMPTCSQGYTIQPHELRGQAANSLKTSQPSDVRE